MNFGSLLRAFLGVSLYVHRCCPPPEPLAAAPEIWYCSFDWERRPYPSRSAPLDLFEHGIPIRVHTVLLPAPQPTMMTASTTCITISAITAGTVAPWRFAQSL